MKDEMSNRNFCVLCDSEITLSDSHVVHHSAGHRKIVVDGERGHILLQGPALRAVLKKIDNRASQQEILLAYKQTEAPIEQPAEQPVAVAPVPVAVSENGGGWLAELTRRSLTMPRTGLLGNQRHVGHGRPVGNLILSAIRLLIHRLVQSIPILHPCFD